MCPPLLAAVPWLGAAFGAGGAAAAGGTAAAAGTAAASTGTFLGMSAATLQTVGTVGSLVGAGIAATGQYKQGQYNAKVAKNNQVIQSQMASDAIRRGQMKQDEQRRKVAGQKGMARAAMGANGVDLSSSTPMGLIEDIAQYGEYDAQLIMSNAEREAYGFQIGAMNQGAQADLAKSSGNYGAASTLLASSGRVASDWAQFNRKY